MNGSLHLGKYYRYLYRDLNLLVVIGYFEEVIRGKSLYEERHRITAAKEPPASSLIRLMEAAALAAVSLAERESWGWTITLPDSSFGLFCGVEPEGMICAVARPAERQKIAAYVQRKKGKEPMTQSYYRPRTGDPVEAVEDYFRSSIQLDTRIALGQGHAGVLVQPLPGGRFDEVASLPGDKLHELLTQLASRGELEPMGEVVMFYECRCDDEMIIDMMSCLPEDKRRELWRDDESLTAECPRCGREYIFERKTSLC